MSVPFIVFSALYSILFSTCQRCHKKRYVPNANGTSRSLWLCLLLLSLSACSPTKNNQVNKHIKFVPSFAEQSLACNTRISIDDKFWSINELAFFISELRITDEHTSYALTLVDNAWQSQNVALIRQSPDCAENRTNLRVSFSFEDSRDLFLTSNESLELRFSLGVPFEINHQNPVTQSSPLNDSSMFWAWRNGYKFIRWDMQNEMSESWSFHLGSVGCESAAMVRAPAQECKFPNRIEVSLPLKLNSLQNNEVVINMDLSLILGDLMPSQSTTCMFSSIDEPSCQKLLNNSGNNKVFSVEPPEMTEGE
jgi:uncharacterized repeat protein (TIGR04052 family)